MYGYNSLTNNLQFFNNSFQSNNALYNGGGMYLMFLDSSINNSIQFFNNSFKSNNASGLGGGIYFATKYVSGSNNTYTLDRGYYEGNQVTGDGGTGGAIYFLLTADELIDICYIPIPIKYHVNSTIFFFSI